MSIHAELIDDPEDFLIRDDRNGLRLTGEAAIAACLGAADLGLSIGRIEGGKWHSPGFEARLDSIWTLTQGPTTEVEMRRQNQAAAAFIDAQMKTAPDLLTPPVDVFIVMARRNSG